MRGKKALPGVPNPCLRVRVQCAERDTISCTLESGIDVGQGITVGPGKLGKKNKRRALNTHVLCSE